MSNCLSSCTSKKISRAQAKTNSGRYNLKHDTHPERQHIPDLSQINDAIPKVELKSRYGNPASYVVLGKKYHVLQNSHGYKANGIASWYGTKFHGFRTSSGEAYDMYAMTAAHKTLPLPCYVRVTNLDNNKSVIVKVTDRGPFPPNRLIDLSYAAATKLDVIRKGTARVRVEAIDPKNYRANETITESAPIPSKQPKNNISTQYLQVAAFRQKDNADQLLSKLKTFTTHPVFIQQEASSKIYKIHIGPLNSNNIAQLTSKLTSLDLIPRLVNLTEKKS